MSGSSYQLLGIVDREAISVNLEELACYKNSTESGYEMTRNFCPNCSTPIFIESTRFRDIRMVLISALEDPEVMEPSYVIWARSKYAWVDKVCKLRRFECGALD